MAVRTHDFLLYEDKEYRLYIRYEETTIAVCLYIKKTDSNFTMDGESFAPMYELYRMVGGRNASEMIARKVGG